MAGTAAAAGSAVCLVSDTCAAAGGAPNKELSWATESQRDAGAGAVDDDDDEDAEAEPAVGIGDCCCGPGVLASEGEAAAEKDEGATTVGRVVALRSRTPNSENPEVNVRGESAKPGARAAGEGDGGKGAAGRGKGGKPSFLREAGRDVS